jgi:hypothetical protein
MPSGEESSLVPPVFITKSEVRTIATGIFWKNAGIVGSIIAFGLTSFFLFLNSAHKQERAMDRQLLESIVQKQELLISFITRQQATLEQRIVSVESEKKNQDSRIREIELTISRLVKE